MNLDEMRKRAEWYSYHPLAADVMALLDLIGALKEKLEPVESVAALPSSDPA